MRKPITVREAIELKKELFVALLEKSSPTEAYVVLATMFDELSMMFGLPPVLTPEAMRISREIEGIPPCPPDCACNLTDLPEGPSLKLVD